MNEPRGAAIARIVTYQPSLPYRTLREPCACGLEVVTVSRLAPDVTEAVRRHQAEPVHVLWRKRVEA